MTRKAYLKVTIICKNALYYEMNEEILYGDVKEYKNQMKHIRDRDTQRT